MESICKICGGSTHRLIDPQVKAEYDVCEQCDFIYKISPFHLSNEEENEQYDLHENTMENEGYVNIFRTLISDYVQELDIKGNVLEFGSGPNPIFKNLLVEAGYNVFDFDPFYNDNEEYKKHTYQLITSNEVFEHFANPLKEMEHLVSLLKTDGYMLISTHFRPGNESLFLNWWYRRDSTHISFYSIKTFEYICQLYGLKIVTHDNKKVIVLQKK